MSASPEAITTTRILPRGWAHLALQFGFWIGFYFVYQAARGFADRDGVATAFANGEWIIDFQSMLTNFRFNKRYTGTQLIDIYSVYDNLRNFQELLIRIALLKATLKIFFFRPH